MYWINEERGKSGVLLTTLAGSSYRHSRHRILPHRDLLCRPASSPRGALLPFRVRCAPSARAAPASLPGVSARLHGVAPSLSVSTPSPANLVPGDWFLAAAIDGWYIANGGYKMRTAQLPAGSCCYAIPPPPASAAAGEI
jgi:hypothetical protein